MLFRNTDYMGVNLMNQMNNLFFSRFLLTSGLVIFVQCALLFSQVCIAEFVLSLVSYPLIVDDFGVSVQAVNTISTK